MASSVEEYIEVFEIVEEVVFDAREGVESLVNESDPNPQIDEGKIIDELDEILKLVSDGKSDISENRIEPSELRDRLYQEVQMVLDRLKEVEQWTVTKHQRQVGRYIVEDLEKCLARLQQLGELEYTSSTDIEKKLAELESELDERFEFLENRFESLADEFEREKTELDTTLERLTQKEEELDKEIQSLQSSREDIEETQEEAEDLKETASNLVKGTASKSLGEEFAERKEQLKQTLLYWKIASIVCISHRSFNTDLLGCFKNERSNSVGFIKSSTNPSTLSCCLV